GLERLDRGREPVVVGIDRERNLAGAPAHPRAERPRGLKAKMAWRGRKEHKADRVGARVERHVERFGRAQAADLDQYRHAFLPGEVLQRRRRFVLACAAANRQTGGGIESRGALTTGIEGSATLPRCLT